MLKLNDTKTDVLIISSPHYLQAVTDIHIQVGDVSIASSKSFKNLGVLFDQTLGLKQHITHICQSAFMQLRNIRCLKQYLSADALVTVAHAFISSRLDYCNSLLVGIPDNCCVKLQRVQNCTARLVTNTRKYDHIMPVLKRLHWLPVKQRITYKLLLLTYKAVHQLAPPYINVLVKLKQSSRQLRSSNLCLLQTPKARLKTYGDVAFSVAAPAEWNRLPEHIRSSPSIGLFKYNLKTFLFDIAFKYIN